MGQKFYFIREMYQFLVNIPQSEYWLLFSYSVYAILANA